MLFVDFVEAFETVPREMLFKVLARFGFPPKIINFVRVFHENVTLEGDLDDDGNTIIIKYDIGVKQGDTPAPVLFTFRRHWRLSFPSSLLLFPSSRLPALRS